MAYFLARHTPNSLRISYTANVLKHRALHTTAVVRINEPKTNIDDAFPDFPEAIEDDELFKAEPTTETPTKPRPTKASRVVRASTSKHQTVKRAINSLKLSPEARLTRFNGIVAFVGPRVGRHPSVQKPQVRNSAWSHLVQLATTEEQMAKIVDMLPKWIEAKGHFSDTFSELFVRRCEELSCPLLALKVYGDYAKYNVRLTLPAARQLLHSLHTKHSSEAIMTAASLYNVYGLTPIHEDAVSCSMVMVASFKKNTKESLKLATSLVPHLETLLKGVKPKNFQVSVAKTYPERPSLWLKWALQKIDKALFKQTKQKVDWLRAWRAEVGHVPTPGNV